MLDVVEHVIGLAQSPYGRTAHLDKLVMRHRNNDCVIAAGLRRLYPTAYPQDEELERDYRSLVHDGLLAQRLDSIEAMENSLEAKTLTDQQLDAWMHSVNSVRLVLGTILDVGEGDELPDADAPDAQQRVLYYILGYLLEQIIDVLFSTVPVEGIDDDPF